MPCVTLLRSQPSASLSIMFAKCALWQNKVPAQGHEGAMPGRVSSTTACESRFMAPFCTLGPLHNGAVARPTSLL